MCAASRSLHRPRTRFAASWRQTSIYWQWGRFWSRKLRTRTPFCAKNTSHDSRATEMDWVNWSQQPKKAILVQFGLASGALLAAVSLWRVHTAQLRWLLLGAAVAGVALALVRPSALRLPYAAISFVAFPIGW